MIKICIEFTLSNTTAKRFCGVVISDRVARLHVRVLGCAVGSDWTVNLHVSSEEHPRKNVSITQRNGHRPINFDGGRDENMRRVFVLVIVPMCDADWPCSMLHLKIPRRVHRCWRCPVQVSNWLQSIGRNTWHLRVRFLFVYNKLTIGLTLI